MQRAFLASLLLLGIVSTLQLNAHAQTGKGSYLDEVQFIHYLDESVAVQEVKAGNLDLYYWRMPLELVQSAKQDPNVKVYESVGGTLSLLLNPAPSNDTLNPFSITEVRYAMNYLIDRQLVVNEILKGFGTPMYSAFSVYDPDYLVLIDTVESFGFNYNPQLASKMISDALTTAGAVKKDGKWFYHDKPIQVKFMIRNDDPKRDAIGEFLSSELDKIGFTVIKDFGDLNKAFNTVYSTDPKLQGWHLYTEGWGGSGFVRYDATKAAQMYAPWFANMPGFQTPGNWNYENSTIDNITQRIFTGNFTSKEARDQLLRNAVEIGVKESVRIFIAGTIDPYITLKDVSGVVNDFGAGITNRFTLIDSRAEHANSLRIGVKQIYQGAWNPVGGLRDVYATKIWGALSDPGTFRNPYTGEVIPIRTPFKVETAGPNGKLDVPKDAIRWDPYSHQWLKVGEGVNATSKVTYDLTYSNWHHGIKMDKNDILYSIYFTYQWGTKTGENDTTFDPEFTSTTEPIVKTLKGFKFLSDDKVEAYFDYWHYDKGEIADYGSVWAVMPWEVTAAMEKIVIDGEAAFSKPAADTKKVSWLSLIISDDAGKVKKTLEKFRQDNFVPTALRGLVSPNDAATRYDAVIKWVDEKKHAVISNGPFYLHSYNPLARTITIKAFRDDSYPFEIGKWKDFEKARVATVSNVNAPLYIIKDSEAVISGHVSVEGDPSTDAMLYYFLKNRNGNMVINGNVTPAANGSFQVSLSKNETRNLSVGPYELKLLAISNFALKPDIYTTSIVGLKTPFAPVTTVPQSVQPNPAPSPSETPMLAFAIIGTVIIAVAYTVRKYTNRHNSHN